MRSAISKRGGRNWDLRRYRVFGGATYARGRHPPRAGRTRYGHSATGGQGLIFALAGVAFGAGGALALMRAMEDLLFQTSATDPVTITGLELLFVADVSAASYIPAR